MVNHRKKLKDANFRNIGIGGKLFINESMAPAFKSIDWKCRQVKKAQLIKECWFFNGNYTVQKNDESKVKISHTIDILNCLNMTEKDLDTLCNEWKDKKASI